jgi:hypothetical protein
MAARAAANTAQAPGADGGSDGREAYLQFV